MRKLRVVFTTLGGAVPALLAAVLVPTVDACGSDSPVSGDASTAEAGKDSSSDSSVDSPLFPDGSPNVDASDGAAPVCFGGFPPVSYIVQLPPPGVVADPGQICAVVSPPVSSNTSARVTLTKYSPSLETADGFIAVPSAIVASMVGLPAVTVSASSDPKFAGLQVTGMAPVSGGYQFQASWPGALPHSSFGGQMTVKTSFTINCGDGATQTVESITKIDFCIDGDSFDWVSSGDACTVCQVIAEMAPSPIVSDNRGDDLPLGRVIRIRVVEVARAGRQVLLFAENDAGDDAKFEWRISGGALERIADDVMLWSMPDEGSESPFGQVAVWNEAGAVVENFLWGAA